MPLSATSPVYLHLLQNFSLITISIIFVPFCTFVAFFSHVVYPYTAAAKYAQVERQSRISSLSTFRPRVILVTGMGMSKGLSIARAFYREGHVVIGADFEPSGVPVCGRFSTALRKFYRLPGPVPGQNGSRTYIDELLGIIAKEGVELWVSCSGVATAIEDAEVGEVVEKESKCIVIQFGAEITAALHEKHLFIQKTHSFGLTVPETHVITTMDDAITQLYLDRPSRNGMQFIMKSILLDDSTRGDMTLLPQSSVIDTRNYLAKLNPVASRPFVLQQFVRGPEYCTHSIVVQGHVVAFTACPSTELLMYYKALPPTSSLSIAMQKYTQIYAEKLGHVTGHLSIDFIHNEDDLEPDLMKRLYPIECNPRAHTAIVLFGSEGKDMVDAYLSAFEGERTDRTAPQPTFVPSNTIGYYWIGHDIITCVLLPTLATITFKSNISCLLGKWRKFFEHVAYWKDGTYEIWDPWPFWWLYCVYWPGIFTSAIITRSWWSRCNASTTKVFRC
jgi:hypothetical protein